MERTTALRRLRKILGADATYRINTSWKGREAHLDALTHARRARDIQQQLSQQMADRGRALCDADPEYQRLKTLYTAARETTSQAERVIPAEYRITVGTANSLFFHVRAEGDSWEEIFRKIAAEQKRSA